MPLARPRSHVQIYRYYNRWVLRNGSTKCNKSYVKLRETQYCGTYHVQLCIVRCPYYYSLFACLLIGAVGLAGTSLARTTMQSLGAPAAVRYFSNCIAQVTH